MASFVEDKIVEILRKTKFSLQIDESTIHSQAILLVYVRFIYNDDVEEELLFLKSLPETTRGEDIFSHIMQHFNDKGIPWTNLIYVALDGAKAMTGKVKSFVSRMKAVAPYISHIHCIVLRQHLAAKGVGGDMEEALNATIHAINFVKANSLNDRLFIQFCETEKFQNTPASHRGEMAVERLESRKICEYVGTSDLKFKSQMADSNYKKQAGKAQEILEKLETAELKSKIFHLSDIFKTVNMLNLEQQDKRSDLVICAQKMKGYVGKLKYWKEQFEKKNLLAFENFKKTDHTCECVTACIVHLKGLHAQFDRRFEDLMKMDYPLWFVDLENYEPGNESTELAETLLDLKEDVKLRGRVNKEGVFAYILIKDLRPNVFRQVEASIIAFPTTWMVESAFSALVDVFSKKRNKSDINSRGTIRLRQNNFVKITFDFLCQKHQSQVKNKAVERIFRARYQH